MRKHHHCGIVIVHTVHGRWKHLEHDWTVIPGSVVYETAASTLTPVVAGAWEVVTLNVQVDDSVYFDEQGAVLAIENWKTMLDLHGAWQRAGDSGQ